MNNVSVVCESFKVRLPMFIIQLGQAGSWQVFGTGGECESSFKVVDTRCGRVS